MAFVRMSLEEAAKLGDVDRATVDAATEEDIRRHMVEDGEDPDAPLPEVFSVVHSPASLRQRLGVTQAEMAARLRLPLTTWRDREQGCVALDPAARGAMPASRKDWIVALRCSSGADRSGGGR